MTLIVLENDSDLGCQ